MRQWRGNWWVRWRYSARRAASAAPPQAFGSPDSLFPTAMPATRRARLQQTHAVARFFLEVRRFRCCQRVQRHCHEQEGQGRRVDLHAREPSVRSRLGGDAATVWTDDQLRSVCDRLLLENSSLGSPGRRKHSPTNDWDTSALVSQSSDYHCFAFLSIYAARSSLSLHAARSLEEKVDGRGARRGG